jgi:hypothetical protein
MFHNETVLIFHNETCPIVEIIHKNKFGKYFISTKYYCFAIDMARGRTRKTDKGSFNENDMRQAVRKVSVNKLSIRKAAILHNVKHQTLARYVKKQNSHQGQEIKMKPNYACRKIFNEEQELALKK